MTLVASPRIPPATAAAQDVDQFCQGRCLTSLARRKSALTVLAIEQFLKPLVQGLRQPELLPVLGQIQLYQHRA